MLKIRVLDDFIDCDKNARKAGSVFETQNIDEAKELISKGLAAIDCLPCRKQHEKIGKDIYVFLTRLCDIGGIETAVYHLVKSFPNRKITMIVVRDIDFDQAYRLSEYCDVLADDGKREYTCDVAILNNYDNSKDIVDRIHARKIYHQSHADWIGLKTLEGYQDVNFEVEPRVDKILSVSETCQKGLKDQFNMDSIVVPNIFNREVNHNDVLVFVCLSRVRAGKGVHKIIDFAKKLREYAEKNDKKFVIFVSSSDDRVDFSSTPEVFTVRSSIMTGVLLRCADYLLQFSDFESFGYSPREAMAEGVVPIVTRIPEFEKIIQDGVNGFLVEKDLSDVDAEKIFKNDLTTSFETDIPEIWNDILDGKI